MSLFCRAPAASQQNRLGNPPVVDSNPASKPGCCAENLHMVQHGRKPLLRVILGSEKCYWEKKLTENRLMKPYA